MTIDPVTRVAPPVNQEQGVSAVPDPQTIMLDVVQRSLKSPDADPGPANNTFGPKQVRPEGDYRNAQDIINSSPLLKNLGDQHGEKGGPSLKQALKNQVGDFDHDADATYRAAQVLEHIERFDEIGKEIKNRPGTRGASAMDTVGNSTVDGFSSKGDARHGTEAGRLQDFGKFGYSSLKGGEVKTPPPPPPPAIPSLPMNNQGRPDNDSRSAQQIIDANPTLRKLGNQGGLKDNLKKQVGDYEHDADAAYRASQVVDYIKNVDEKGQPITKKSSGNDPTNDRIDGFSRDGGKEVANHGTEAGRLQDFGKYGYDSLKGIDSKSADEQITRLNGDATADAVKAAGGDASKLGKDYFTNGQTSANGADKTAALIKLSETVAKYKVGQEAYQTTGPGDEGPYHGEGPSPGQQREAFYKDAQAKVDQLAKDPDVQQFVNEKVPDALHARVEADPKLKAELQRRFDDTSSPRALQAAFDRKDSNGKSLDTAQALGDFVKAPNFYAQALGIKPNLQEVMKKAPKELQDKVKADYENITSGKEIQGLIAAGTPPDKALIQSGVDKAVFDNVLDDKTVAAGTDKFNETSARIGRDQLLQGKSLPDLYKGLGVKDANDPALAQLVEKNLDKLVPPGPNSPSARDIVSFLRGVDDIGRGGAKFDDAMTKVKESWKAQPGMSEAFKSGVMHAASGVLLAGALAAGSATGSQSRPAVVTGQSFQTAGLLVEGGSKFLLDQFSRGNVPGQAVAPSDSLKNWLKDAENVGKGLGGVVGNAIGLITGAMGAKDAAARGDKVGAGFQGTFAALNGLSAVVSGAEVASYVVGRVIPSVADAATLVSGLAGTVAGAVGGVAALGGMIYSIVSGIKADEKKDKAINTWYDGIKTDLDAFGIKPPDLGATLAKPNAYAVPGSELTPMES